MVLNGRKQYVMKLFVILKAHPLNTYCVNKGHKQFAMLAKYVLYCFLWLTPTCFMAHFDNGKRPKIGEHGSDSLSFKSASIQ